MGQLISKLGKKLDKIGQVVACNKDPLPIIPNTWKSCISVVDAKATSTRPPQPKPTPNKRPPPPPPPPDYGTTVVRFTIGSHERFSMGGSLPNIAIFSELGHRIGQTEPRIDKTIEGSFRDVAIKHKKTQANVRASYLSMMSGKEPICIASMALLYPDGGQNFFTGSDLAYCLPNIRVEQSRTFVGPRQDQPKCFWLQGTDSKTQSMYGLNLHLPDLTWTKTRVEAYRENQKLACGSSPRYWPLWEGNVKHRSISKRILIFNPPLEYDPETGYDTDPSRVLNWIKLPRSHGDCSDPDVPFHHPRGDAPYLNMTTPELEASAYFNAPVSPSTPDQIEEARVRRGAPALVVSANATSAQRQCRDAAWNHTDFVSLAEQLYCDMQSRSLIPFCAGPRDFDCWNADTHSLQRSTADALLQTQLVKSGNATALEQTWNATGPLYGYAYGSVRMVA